MPRLKLAGVLESLQLPLRPALQLAATLGVQGVQVDAVGELAPDALSGTGRKEFKHLLRSLGLELAALGCPLRHGLNVPTNLEARLQHIRKVMTLAFDLGPRLIVAFAGPVPSKEDRVGAELMTDSLLQLGRHGERIGVTLALAAGAEPPLVLAEFLQSFTCGGLGVVVDPASLLMRGHDPLAAVRTFQHQLVYVQGRDALPDRPDRIAEEVPLGHGDLDWVAFLGALEEIGYRGWLAIRRGPSQDPAGDIKAGAAFLRRLGA
jgi:sugar phosphate isomerase/epimerase